jgi:hypothetical protein
VVVRTTLDIPDEAYYLAKAIARDRNRSLGRVVGDLILQSVQGVEASSIKTPGTSRLSKTRSRVDLFDADSLNRRPGVEACAEAAPAL